MFTMSQNIPKKPKKSLEITFRIMFGRSSHIYKLKKLNVFW